MVSRREVLKSSAVALVVTAFSPGARAWSSDDCGPDDDELPDLDGEVVVDAASLAAASQDAGYLPPRTPWAVLRPGSVADIQKMIRFCKRHRISVSARGQGHTTDGQGLNEGGLVISMDSLATVHSITSHGSESFADVDAGVKWSDLLPMTLAAGRRPPALTGFLGLSVGGTLSVGGISSTYASGSQLDNVESIEVVDGRGERLTCSRRKNTALFHAVLGGLGQCAVIVRAKLRLIRAREFARVYTLNYADPAAFFADMRLLLDRGEVDDCYNLGLPDGAGGWIYQMTIASYFDGASPPDDAFLLRGLSGLGADPTTQDMPYVQYALRVDFVIGFFRSIGLWDGVMHPWFDVFLPESTVEEYVTEVTASLAPEDVGPTGFLLLFPQRRSAFRAGSLRIPGSSEWVFLYDILTAAPAPGYDPSYDAAMRARNRRLYERAVRAGGTRYPIGTLPFSKLDWIRHFGPLYHGLRAEKARHDPSRILTPGPGIF